MSYNPTSRPNLSRCATSVPRQAQAGEDLILPDGAVEEGTAELLAEFLRSGSHQEAAPDHGDIENEGELVRRRSLPWWKTPSPYWLLFAIPLSSLAMSATIAPRVEIYRMLACSVHKPDIFREDYPEYVPRASFTAYRSPSNISIFSSPSSSHSLLPIGPSNEAGTPVNLPFSKSQKCATDPVVTAAVATLIAVISVCTGLLSLITTAWWGAFSDRHGRVKVMGVSIIGLLLTDAGFLLVTNFYRHLPGGYWWLVVGPTIEGLLGGYTTAAASAHAYIADTTNEGNRSRILSLNLGLMFSGMAFGPTVGSLLFRTFHHPLAVFYMATACHALYTFLVWFILPESVTELQMTKAKARHIAALEANNPPNEYSTSLKILFKLRLLFSFLSPLATFWPSDRDFNHPLKRRARDWNLTLTAIAYGFVISVMGSYQYKFQYASLQFGWTTETIGYWLSLVGAARAIFLVAILPAPTSTETTPLLSGSEPSEQLMPKMIKKEIHSPSFDLGLARFSILVEIICYTFMAFALTSIPFTTASLIASFGAGFTPALQSVTLALYTRRGGTEVGRLFGALAVIQTLSAQILGPALYGFVFVKTITAFPSAIMFVSVFSALIAFLALLLVRSPNQRHTFVDCEDSSTSSSPPSN
ncbi:major facilitator superfamily domain-containing protein [Crepidotus variabilis]|uniref:Major facilitator superfamily domain-containing protein n=1 Tax=Crepidotus variabilis TaxID=179855 RepID=A0A9P6JTX0_9AGAR|nr:major facilitator superfamily domain-containing protein [Crepidotus variabilis]